MIRTTTKAMAAILVGCPALAHAGSDQIRAKLLGTAEWAYQTSRAGGMTSHKGKVWFVEEDGKLIGYVDAGWNCDAEVTVRPDGFDMEICTAGDKHFVRSGDGFTATLGSYTYTIRPAP